MAYPFLRLEGRVVRQALDYDGLSLIDVIPEEIIGTDCRLDTAKLPNHGDSVTRQGVILIVGVKFGCNPQAITC